MRRLKPIPGQLLRMGSFVIFLAFASVAQEPEQSREGGPLTHEETIRRALQDLQSDNIDTRVGSIMLLGKYRVADALSAVVAGLFDDHVRVRRAALVSLIEMQSSMPPYAVEPILLLMKDDDPEIRRMVSSSLSMLVSLWNTYFQGNEQAPIRQGLPLAIRQGFIEAFLDEEVVVRRNMLSDYFFLGIQLPESILLRLLADEDDLVRLEALRLAGRISHFGSVLQLAYLLVEDPVQSIRLLFANMLGNHRISSGIDWLEIMLEDRDDEVVKEAELSLFRILPHAREALRLTEHLKTGSFNQQQGISFIRSLSLLKEQGRPFVESILESENPTYRLEALRIFLAHSDLQADAGKLAGLANDKSERLRLHLAAYLMANREKAPVSLIEVLALARYEKMRETALNLTRELPRDRAETLLLDFLIDETPRLRVQALDELKRRQYSGIRNILHLSLEDPDGLVQRRSVVLLMGLNDPEELNYLRSVMEKDPKSPLAHYIKDQMLKRLGVQL